MFISDESTSNLLKLATQYADDEDWNNAIEVCRKAKQSVIESDALYPTAILCKLGLYLSRAGKYEESISELNSLFDLIPILQRKFYCSSFSHPAPLPDDLLEASCFCHYRTVHESLRTVYRRAKLLKLAEQQEDLIEACDKKHAKYIRKYEAWYKKTTAARRQEILRQIDSIKR